MHKVKVYKVLVTLSKKIIIHFSLISWIIKANYQVAGIKWWRGNIFHAVHNEFMDFVSVLESRNTQRIKEWLNTWEKIPTRNVRLSMQSLQGPEITRFWEVGAGVVVFLLCECSAFTRSVIMVIFTIFTIMFKTQDTLKVLCSVAVLLLIQSYSFILLLVFHAFKKCGKSWVLRHTSCSPPQSLMSNKAQLKAFRKGFKVCTSIVMLPLL